MYTNIIHTINDIIVSSFLYLLLNSARDACNSKRIKPRIRFSAETKNTNYLSILIIFYISVYIYQVQYL